MTLARLGPLTQSQLITEQEQATLCDLLSRFVAGRPRRAGQPS
jgi:hypothetical protein